MLNNCHFLLSKSFPSTSGSGYSKINQKNIPSKNDENHIILKLYRTAKCRQKLVRSLP
jgi:hypothetical protein